MFNDNTKRIVTKFLLCVMAIAMTASAGMYLSQDNLVLVLFSIFAGAFCLTAALEVDSMEVDDGN
jgi:hypothetical protein